MLVKVNILNNQSVFKINNDVKKLVKSACKETLKFEDFKFDAEINVTFVDDNQIKEINAEYRNIDSSTDVLSFPLSDNGEYDFNPENNCAMLGDVIISTEHALSQGEKFGHGTDREIAFLTVHSVLHLLGYDHVNNEAEEKIMRNKQTEILNKMGLSVK